MGLAGSDALRYVRAHEPQRASTRSSREIEFSRRGGMIDGGEGWPLFRLWPEHDAEVARGPALPELQVDVVVPVRSSFGGSPEEGLHLPHL